VLIRLVRHALPLLLSSSSATPGFAARTRVEDACDPLRPPFGAVRLTTRHPQVHLASTGGSIGSFTKNEPLDKTAAGLKRLQWTWKVTSSSTLRSSPHDEGPVWFAMPWPQLSFTAPHRLLPERALSLSAPKVATSNPRPTSARRLKRTTLQSAAIPKGISNAAYGQNAKRIRGLVLLGRQGRMSQGMVLRRAPIAGPGRRPIRVKINGIPVHKLWQSASDDPNQLPYEFVVDGTKRSGYIAVDLLGNFRPDGLIGVIYDPLNPELHAALPVIERYVTSA
jgi:hypothetical protein